MPDMTTSKVADGGWKYLMQVKEAYENDDLETVRKIIYDNMECKTHIMFTFTRLINTLGDAVYHYYLMGTKE